jgi:hypothetical protein
MIHHAIVRVALVELLLCVTMTGCGGADPLVMVQNPPNPGPWCGPNQRAQVGQRVVGRVAWGQKKWKFFLVDDAGKEYDPDQMADEIWSYLERTGDAKKMEHAFNSEGFFPRMTIVSIKPVIVILESFQVAPSPKQLGASPARYYWLAQIYAIANPAYKEGLQWFSPDLKHRPTALPFSQAGIAEIPLPKGKFKVIRDGDKCKTTRE